MQTIITILKVGVGLCWSLRGSRRLHVLVVKGEGFLQTYLTETETNIFIVINTRLENNVVEPSYSDVRVTKVTPSVLSEGQPQVPWNVSQRGLGVYLSLISYRTIPSYLAL